MATLLSANSKPNIVIILSDDMGYGDVQAYNKNSKIPTPHLNQLAKDGIRFTDAHAAGSVCVPSRYGLMTGRFPVRAPSMQSKNFPVIEKGRSTIASLLKRNGYQTSMVGKWHLGFDMKTMGKTTTFNYAQPLKSGPIDKGFDTFWGMHASLDIPPYFFINGRKPIMPPTESIGDNDSMNTEEGWNRIQGAFWRAGPVAPDFKHDHITPQFKNEAIKVINQYGKSKQEKPLFLYLALPSPHTPWLPTEEFRGKSGAGMYGDFVMQVDDVVGQVRASLKANQLDQNTLILFSSDNGPVWYDVNTEKFQHDAVGGLTGMKFSPHEGGHRVPFLVSWPASLKANSVSDSTVSFVDIYSTLNEIVSTSALNKNEAEDSQSFLPALKSPSVKKARKAILHDKRTIRSGDYKLILGKKKGASPLLYNIVLDKEEKHDLYQEKKGLAEKLKKELSQLLSIK